MIDVSERKVKWLIRQLCNISIYKRKNGEYFTSLASPLILRQDEFNDEEVRTIIARTNDLISQYISKKVDDNIDDSFEIDKEDLFKFVIENF